MLAHSIDTHGVIKRLEASGFSRVQAERITEILTELTETHLATKTDLELGLAKQTITLLTWMTGMLVAQGGIIVAFIEYLK